MVEWLSGWVGGWVDDLRLVTVHLPWRKVALLVLEDELEATGPLTLPGLNEQPDGRGDRDEKGCLQVGWWGGGGLRGYHIQYGNTW